MSGRNTLLRNARFVILLTCLNKLIHVCQVCDITYMSKQVNTCVPIFILLQICNPRSPQAIHVNLTPTTGHPAKNSPHKIISDIRKIAPPRLYSLYHQTLSNMNKPCYHRTIAMSYLLKYTVLTSGAIM